jgi:glutathione synthase
MHIQMGIVMDAIESIKTPKDSSFAMLLAAQKRGWDLVYMTLADLYLREGVAYAQMRRLKVTDNTTHWFEFIGDSYDAPLADLPLILMRKDPPFDFEYLASTYILEQAEAAGSLVVNRLQSLRDANEKLYTAWFPQCCVPSLVSRKATLLKAFLAEQHDIILKPLDGMGGASIFRVREGDPNTNVILETLTQHGQAYTMAQRFIPEISAGDKRILLLDGEPVPYALARIPQAGETRGNLAVGGRAEGVELSERDHWICQQVAPTLREKGLYFVGLDVIGSYLTEINVTSPTCIRQLDNLYNLDIAGDFLNMLATKL